MRSRLKGLLAGAGSMGVMHLRVLHGIEAVDSLAVVEPVPERREQIERRYPRVRTYAALDDPLSAEHPDFACVAVPVGEAPAVAAAVIDAGVPLMLEKPMAQSVEEAQAIAQHAEREGVFVSIGYVERFNPAVQALREEIRRGTGGTIYHAHARRLSPFPQREGLSGVAIDLATHDLDVIRYVIDSTPVRVYAETAALGASLGEDLLCASLRYENGVTGLLEANWHSPRKVRELSITTEGGMFVVSYLTQDLFLHEQPSALPEWETLGVMRGANEGRVIRFALHRKEPLAAEWEAFFSKLDADGEPPVPAADGVDVLAAARAMIESGRVNRPIEGAAQAGPRRV
jgi:UDP-N-acetylglucosamine 3-dehydrogenase